MSSTVAAWKPFSTKTSRAAASSCLRRSCFASLRATRHRSYHALMRTWLALTLSLGCGAAQPAPAGGVQQIGIAIEEPDLDEPELLAVDFPLRRVTWIA